MNRYYYIPGQNRVIELFNEHPEFIELTTEEYWSLSAFLHGGFGSLISALYKCGIVIPQDDYKKKPEYALDYCGDCCNKKEPVRYFDYGGECGDYLCRDCWSKAEKRKA